LIQIKYEGRKDNDTRRQASKQVRERYEKDVLLGPPCARCCCWALLSKTLARALSIDSLTSGLSHDEWCTSSLLLIGTGKEALALTAN
jgi:hypothetical protein